jgi:hypothetical protein
VKPSIVLATAVFGLIVAGIIFCLGYVLLKLDLVTALIVAGALGCAQAVGGLFYIWRRFKYRGPPPRDGGIVG